MGPSVLPEVEAGHPKAVRSSLDLLQAECKSVRKSKEIELVTNNVSCVCLISVDMCRSVMGPCQCVRWQ